MNRILNQVYLFELLNFRAENPVEIRNIRNNAQLLWSDGIGLKSSKFPNKNIIQSE